MPSDPNAKWRVAIGFLSLFVVSSVGAYFARDLVRLREDMAVRERQAALQRAIDARDRGESLQQHLPPAKAADETNAAIEKLTNEIAPPGTSQTVDFFRTASPGDLEALRRDLKTAQANATTFLPRYIALLKAERAAVEQYARANLDKGTAAKLLASIDRRHAEITDVTTRMLSARADYYRAYEDYVAFLARELGSFKVNKGQFVFSQRSTYDQYKVVAGTMAAAANRVGDADQEEKNLLTSQRDRLAQSVNGK